MVNGAGGGAAPTPFVTESVYGVAFVTGRSPVFSDWAI